MDNILSSVHQLEKLYNNVNYWDEYGTSFIIFILLMLVLFVIHSYFYVITHVEPIKKNWLTERCSPKVIPFAGIINRPDGKGVLEFTEENFTYCVQNILSKISSYALEPVTFLTHTLEGILNSIGGDIQSIRSMFNNVRTNLQSISEEIMGRLINIMAPLQEVIIVLRDLFGKIQGVMTAGLYTLFGSYMTLQTLFGAIIQALISILIMIAATIAILMVIPFMQALAAVDIGIFIAICIPTILLSVFAYDILQIQSPPIPTLCFDKLTPLLLKDGSCKFIENIEVGDLLEKDVVVTAKIMVHANNSKMYNLNNIIVSGTHHVLFNDEWIPIFKHPHAILLEEYKEPFLFCINTSSKKINVLDTVFCDWDELFGDTLKNIPIHSDFIHTFTDGGFKNNTKIRMKNGLKKNISDVKIGDILEKGEKVYGIVEVYGADLNQYTYDLGNLRYFEGGYNLYFEKNKSFISTLDLYEETRREKETLDKKLYHLLTDTKSFNINSVKFCDYNNCLEMFLKKEVI